MAKLLFDGHAHILTLLDDEGKRIASWEGSLRFEDPAWPQHPTMGCICTRDEAMLQLRQYMKEHPLSIIDVQNNSAWRAHSASKRLNGRPLQAGVKQRQGAR